MKNEAQQRICELLKEFRETKAGEAFEKLLSELFRCPLLFPMGTGEQKGQLLLAEHDGKRLLSAFTDMEEAERANLKNVEFTPFTLEEYCRIVAQTEVEGLAINLFNPDNCIINRSFFQTVIVPAFDENRVMPALQSLETKEYTLVNKVPFAIGRSEQANLVLSDQTISPIHALIIERENKYYVVDQNSLNGVYVNGNKVEKEQQIAFDDVIEFCDAEYAFVPMGLANRQAIGRSVYGDEPTMVGSGAFLMEHQVLPQAFFENTEAFLEEIVKDKEAAFRKYFLIGLELACAAKEQELKITDQNMIEDQRKYMLGKGLGFLQQKDYGITEEKREGYSNIVSFSFPKGFQVPGLALKMYFVLKESGEKLACAIGITSDALKLVKIEPGKETELGNAPQDENELLEAVLRL